MKKVVINNNKTIEIINKKEKPTILIDHKNIIEKSIDFALIPYKEVLTSYQFKLHAMALLQIQKDEDPNERKKYRIDISDYEEYFELSNKAVRQSLNRSARQLHQKQPSLIIKDGSKETIMNIYQSITTSTKNNKIIEFEFNNDFRQLVIESKKYSDFQIKLNTLILLNTKYSFGLYNFLLANLAQGRKYCENLFESDDLMLKVKIDDIIKAIDASYNEKTISAFMRHLRKAIKDINENISAEFTIVGDDVKTIFTDRAISDLEFQLRMKNTIVSPFKQEQIESDDPELPKMSYIISRIRELKVNESFLDRIRKEGDREKAWKSFLYVIPRTRTAKYFNSTYSSNYTQNMKVYDLYSQALGNDPEVFNDWTCGKINTFYMQENIEQKLIELEEKRRVEHDERMRNKLLKTIKK